MIIILIKKQKLLENYYWKKKRKEKNSNYIDHKNISEVLYISLLFYISKRC